MVFLPRQSSSLHHLLVVRLWFPLRSISKDNYLRICLGHHLAFQALHRDSQITQHRPPNSFVFTLSYMTLCSLAKLIYETYYESTCTSNESENQLALPIAEV